MSIPLIHLLVHKVLLESCYMKGGVITREEAWKLISNRIRFKEKISPTTLRNTIIKEMVAYGLLERVNHKELRIINRQRSGGLERII